MPFDQYILLLTIAGSASITPGPNNALLATFGATHGFRATLPHILGIVLGFPFMIFLVGLFLGEIFQSSPTLQLIVQVVGVAILLWLAWRTATTGSVDKGAVRRPFTFWQSAGFQWLNPKGWTFTIGITSQFVDPERPIVTAFACASAFVIVGTISALTWAFAGQAINRVLTSDLRRRAFNIAMGALIALSVVMLFWG